MRAAIAVTACLVSFLMTAPAASALLTQPNCPEGLATVAPFKRSSSPVVDWRENLAFDGLGGMWVSRTGQVDGGRYERYNAGGELTTVIPVPTPSGIVRGPDGLMYAGHAGGVIVRFDPAEAQPVPEVFATGVPGSNGMGFDSDGNLYGTNDAAAGMSRILPDGTIDQAWRNAASGIWGTNGIAIVGDTMFTPVTFDQRAPILRVPLSDPTAYSTLTHLSFGVASTKPALFPGNLRLPLLPKGPDDLVAAPGGVLYVAAFVTGELIKVDQTTGRACVAAKGLGMPTSVRFPDEFGSFDEARDLFVTEASGNIRQVRLPG